MNTPVRPFNPMRIATTTKKSKCTKAKNGNHQWKEIGVVPGAQEECTYCKTIINWK